MREITRTLDLLNKLLDWEGELIDRSKIYLAGGALRTAGQPIKDFDFFVEDEKTLKQFTRFMKNTFSISNSTDFADTYTTELLKQPIQVIKLTTGTPEEVVNSFDFTVNSNYVRLNENLEEAGKRFVDTNELVMCSNWDQFRHTNILGRLFKLLAKGYKISSKEYKRVLTRCIESTPDDMLLSGEHLGVDYDSMV